MSLGIGPHDYTCKCSRCQLRRAARQAELLAQESGQPESWWWLSFADERGFLGGVLTQARRFVSALLKTNDLGINPGGECQGAKIPDETIAASPFDHAQFADRLLSREEIDAKLGGARKMPEKL